MLTINIMLHKEDYGVPGSSDYRRKMPMATAGLPEKFGLLGIRLFLVEKKKTTPRVSMCNR